MQAVTAACSSQSPSSSKLEQGPKARGGGEPGKQHCESEEELKRLKARQLQPRPAEKRVFDKSSSARAGRSAARSNTSDE